MVAVMGSPKIEGERVADLDAQPGAGLWCSDTSGAPA